MKTCTRCGIEKPETEFYKNSKSKNGLCTQCKECSKTQSSEQYGKCPEKKHRYYVKQKLVNPKRLAEISKKANEKYWSKPSNIELQRKRAKEWKKTHPLHGRKLRLRQYGLDEKAYVKMLNDQCHVCAICGKTEWENRYRILYIDHDHVTGKVRGLLCNDCNTLLGKAHDNLDTIRASEKYLLSRRY